MPRAEAAFSLINSQLAEQPAWWAGWACYSYLTVEEIKTQSFHGMQLVKDYLYPLIGASESEPIREFPLRGLSLKQGTPEYGG